MQWNPESIAVYALIFAAFLGCMFIFFSSLPQLPVGNKHALLVIAHPDDESMFFVPALRALRNAKWRISILCMTNGSGGGDGAVRTRELKAAGKIFDVAATDIHVKNMAELPDSMTATWDRYLVASTVQGAVSQLRPDMVITFDEHGISSHANHIAVHRGVALYSATQEAPVPCYELTTVGIWRKFTSVFDAVLTLALYMLHHTARATGIIRRRDGWPTRMLLANPSPFLSDSAMAAHASQYVWFRKLFIYFSRYVFFNDLQRIN